MATKKKKVRSHVKRVKLQQKKNPVSQEKYEKRLKVARKKDFFRRLRNVILILAIAFCALFAAGNLMLTAYSPGSGLDNIRSLRFPVTKQNPRHHCKAGEEATDAYQRFPFKPS